jgi:hypothetical protein
MLDPQTTISVYRSFLDGERAKIFLESKGISTILVEDESGPSFDLRDVVHLRVAESEAARATEMLNAERLSSWPSDRDPNLDPPPEGVPTCRCPFCGRAFSTEYDFCPYCEPPADWLAKAIPTRKVSQDKFAFPEPAQRSEPVESERDKLAWTAFCTAALGICVCPLACSLVSLGYCLAVALRTEEMRNESWMYVYLALGLSLVELGVIAMVFTSLLAR